MCDTSSAAARFDYFKPAFDSIAARAVSMNLSLHDCPDLAISRFATA
jgi:hypothetical protein